MTVHLFLYPTLSAAYDHIAARVADGRERWLLTPIEAVAAPVAAWHERVWQPATLAQFLVQSSGAKIDIAPRLYTLRVIGEILDELSVAGDLLTLAPVARKRGMIREVSRWIRELETQGVSPEIIAGYDPDNPLEQELARVYAAYLGVLRGRGEADADGIVSDALRFVTANRLSWLANIHLSVVGFDQLVPTPRRLLRALTDQGASLAIYLAGDPQRPAASLALARLGVTYRQLQQELQPEEEILLPLAEGSPAPLRHLRERLFEPPRPSAPADHVRAVAAPSREAEVRAALRASHRLIRDGAAPRDIALLAPDPTLYRRLVQAVASDYQIPVRLSQPLQSNPAVAACVALSGLAAQRFPRRETIDALRSPYVQHGLTIDELDRLDRLTRERPVIAGTDQWAAALQPYRHGPGTEGFTDDALGAPPLWQSIEPGEMEALRDKLRGLFRLLTPPERATPFAFRQWIETVLLGVGAIDTATTRTLGVAASALAVDSALRDRPAIERFVDLLGVISRPDDRVRVTRERYRADLLDLLSEDEVFLPAPADALYFGPLTEGRRRVMPHLFVLGLNEGEFPHAPAPDLFYAPAERAVHPYLREDFSGDEASLWWQTLSNTMGTVTLLRPRLDEKGNGTLASPYWSAVLAQFDGLVAQAPPLDDFPSWKSAIGLNEQLVAMAAGPPPQEYPAVVRRMWSIVRRAEEIRARRDAPGPAGVYEGMIESPLLLSELQRRYGPHRDWSVSQLHRYAECPYGFFAQHVLALRSLEEPEERLDPRTSGQIYHAILESLYGWMRETDCLPAPGHEKSILGQLDALCDEAFASAPLRYQFRPGALWAQEQREMRRHLHALLKWECELDRGLFPHEQERRFGNIRGSRQINLELDAGGFPFRLQGVIDRIDTSADGQTVHIVDYKSGNSKYDEKKIRTARALQTALYALALEKMGLRVRSSRYLHIRKREESGVLEFDRSVEEHETVRAALERVAWILQSIRAGHFPAHPAEANKGSRACRDRCELASICRVTRASIRKAEQSE